MNYYQTKDNDSWSKLCNSMKIDYNQRRIFYDWLSKVHGYGAIAPDESDRFEFEQDNKPPWMKFYDPYSTFHSKTRQLIYEEHGGGEVLVARVHPTKRHGIPALWPTSCDV